jgi:hypothetical protein
MTLQQRIMEARQKARTGTAAEGLAESVGEEQKEESGFRSFLSFAAPIAAGLVLPGIGGALAPLLSGALGAGGLGLSGGALSAAMTGLGAAGTGLGTRAISEGLEQSGRALGAGGEEEDIIGGGAFGEEAQKKAREQFTGSIEDYGKSQNIQALMSGITAGVGDMESVKALGEKFKGKTGDWMNKLLGKGTATDIAAPDFAGEMVKGMGLPNVDTMANISGDVQSSFAQSLQEGLSVGSGGAGMSDPSSYINMPATPQYQGGVEEWLSGLEQPSPVFNPNIDPKIEHQGTTWESVMEEGGLVTDPIQALSLLFNNKQNRGY